MSNTAVAGAAPERLKKRRISLLIVAHVANDSYFGFLPPLLPLIVERMDLPLSLAGLLATTLSITGAVGQPLFGYFADRIKKGWLLALGPLGGALLAFMLYMPNFWMLMLLMLVAGSGSACFHPVASVIAGQSAGARKGFGMSLYVAGGRLGVGLGSGMATFIVTKWGIDAIPYASLVGIIIGIPLFFVSPPIRDVGGGSSQSFMQTMRMLRLVFRPLFLLWVVNLCRTTVTMTVQVFLPIYIIAKGGSLAAGGVAITLFLVAATVGGIYGGHLSDIFGRRIVTIMAICVGTPALGMAFLFDEPLRTIFVMLSGAAFYSQMGVSVTYAQEIAPGHAGLVSSFMLGVVWFVASIGMIAVGGLADYIGVEQALPIVCMAFGVVGSFLSLGLPKETA